MPPKTVLLCALILSISGTHAKFRVIREWNFVNFTWDSADTYKNAVEQKTYIPENNIIAGIKYFDGFYYITLPRMKEGVPVTLARIPAGISNDTAPLLTPFPSWELNNVDDCNALQNVQNIEVDPKGHVWIIDGGRTETLSPNPVTKCQPKLVVYDVKKMENVLTYTFPENVASFNGSFLYDIVVDNTEEGYAYITDNGGRDPGIIVFSIKHHHAWKIRHSQSMRADPNAVFFRVNAVSITASLNIASIALGPKIHTSNDKIVLNEDREVFYAPLSSLHLYSINSSVLRNEEFATNNGEYQGQVKDYGMKASQSVGMIMDNQGVLYYSLLASSSVARWDSRTPFQTGQKIVARDERYLEWPNSFTFDGSGNLTLLVNRLNRFIYETLNLTEPNFRLISSSIGGKSYLYDETYSYSYSDGGSSTTSSSTTEKEETNPMKPGMDQDPYLAPQPEPEPQPEPKNENEHEGHKHEENSTTGKPRNVSENAVDSGVDRMAVGLISMLGSVLLIVF